jgi:hypothetical protein
MSLHLVLSVGTICAISTGRYGSPSVAHQLSHVLVREFFRSLLVIPLARLECICAKKRGCISIEQNAALSFHLAPHDRTQCPSKHPFCPELFG